MKKILCLNFIFTLVSILPAQAFDLEDYATTYRATRDAYLKAANELKLATGPYKASRDAYVTAVQTYVSTLKDGTGAVVKAKQTKVNIDCGIIYKDSESDNISGDPLISTEIATREAYLKAAKEVMATAYALKSSEDAYKIGSQTYLQSTEIHPKYMLLQQRNVLKQK